MYNWHHGMLLIIQKGGGKGALALSQKFANYDVIITSIGYDKVQHN